jgi:uncharacterized protein (DUF58 family)
MAKPSANSNLDIFLNILNGVDKTYSNLPLRMKMDIERISSSMTQFGPRRMRRAGLGSEFFESRDYRPGVDEIRKIHARLSGRAGRPIVVEKEAEVPHNFFLWRDATSSMNYSSNPENYTKKQASEVMLLAFAKHLARNEEQIGIIDAQGVFRGARVTQSLANQLLGVSVMAGDMPVIARRLPENSTAVLFSDFLVEQDALVQSLGQLNGLGLNGFMVMVLDPQEIDFKFKGHTEFKGMEGEGTKAFKKAESMRIAYHEKMRQHIDGIEKICRSKGFRFIIQRTDQPLHNGLLAIYGLTPNAPAYAPVAAK